MSHARKVATYADVLAAPDHLVAEIVDGELSLQPRPASPHARAASRLGGSLDGPFDRGRGGPGGWIILDEPELHMGGDILVPDLAGWRRERMATIPAQAYFTTPPDWVCEVLSPSTAKLDRFSKLPIYWREGVSHVWFIDPIARMLEVFRRADPGWKLVNIWVEKQVVRAEPFEAMELALEELWADVENPER